MRTWFILCALIGGLNFSAGAQQASVFERIFGMPRELPAELVEAVRALPPGERLERDTQGDGVIDEYWYLDTDKRHTIQPLLVIVRDEDGDFAETGRGDLDSDLYFYDHHANGYIDVVVDYQDDNGDGTLDQMGIFYDKDWKDGIDDLTVWWAVDIGGDNRLWFDVNGNYYQNLCQWRTHFGGDELFYQFRLTEDDERWLNVWEDPFAFYDLDGDGASEMVIRISAVGDAVQNLRFSIDADDDAYGKRTRDYDFSVTALPPEEGLSPAPSMTESLTIRGIETHPVLTWENTPEFARNAAWGKAMLIWDEINSNTDKDPAQDPNERWEGLLNHASKHGDFPQIGGPPCSPYNKRFEVAHPPASPLTLYFSGEDRRFHLLGAQYGYLDIDYDLDGEIDAAYTWEDTTGDGVFDVRRADINNDGAVDFEQVLTRTGTDFPLAFESISPDYVAALEQVLEESQRFIDAAVSTLGAMPQEARAVIDYFDGPLLAYHPEAELGAYIRKTPAGARFYTDLVRDRLFVALRGQRGDDPGWAATEAAYLQGQYDAAAHLLGAPDTPLPSLRHGGQEFTQHIVVQVAHGAGAPQDDVPVTVEVDRLRQKAPDFNPRNCRVVEGDFRLAWRVIPHQIDDWTLGGAEQLSFLADLPAEGGKTYHVFYAPAGQSAPGFPKLTHAVPENPGYIAWESDAGAYRLYTGQFDFFGKHEWRVIPRVDRLIYPIVGVNYHEEQDWGMDALHVGKTSGLGGLTLYRGGEALPVQSPAGEGHVDFAYRVLGSGPVRAAVEIVAQNVFPNTPGAALTMRCFIYAHRAESEVQVQLPEGYTDAEIAPGLMHVSEAPQVDLAARGMLADWGFHAEEIGEIGLAVIVPPGQVQGIAESDGETRIRCAPEDGPVHLRYWILGGWRRGMQYPIAPTIENWTRDVERLIIQDVDVEVL